MRFRIFAFTIALSFIFIANSAWAHPAKAITYCSGTDPQPNTDGYDNTIPVDESCGSIPSTLKKYLISSGYNEVSAAGIMGNISVESCGYKLRVYNNSCNSLAPDGFIAYKNGKKTFSGGYGLVQWTSANRVKSLQEHADSLGKSVNTLEVQATFAVKELKSSSYRLFPSKLNAMSLAEVTWIIMRDYETPETVICTAATSNSCKNQESARHISLSELMNNSIKYSSAYASFSTRYERVKAAKDISTSKCGTTTDPDNPDDPTPVSPPGGDQPPSSPSTSGALGKQTSSGYYAQCKASYSSNPWRKDGSSICDSGCSLVAVANAAKYLNVSPNNPGDLASWTQSRISGSSGTGWNGSVSKLISHLNMKWDGSYLWSSYSTATSTKIAKIRQTLAAGGVVIAGGDRNSVDKTINCENGSNKTAGLCVFSPKGHFITIIGITADDKLIVANPANGKNGSSTSDKLPADNVLKFSNKAIAVYK